MNFIESILGRAFILNADQTYPDIYTITDRLECGFYRVFSKCGVSGVERFVGYIMPDKIRESSFVVSALVMDRLADVRIDNSKCIMLDRKEVAA